MKNLNNYIIEKLIINKDSKVLVRINEDEYSVKYTGLTLSDFFLWWSYSDNINELINNENDFADMIEQSNIIGLIIDAYKDCYISARELDTDELNKIKKILFDKDNLQENIILYEKQGQTNEGDFCYIHAFEVDFLDKPIIFYSNYAYGNGRHRGKYNMQIEL